MRRMPLYLTLGLITLFTAACRADRATPDGGSTESAALTDKYTSVRLTTDMSQLSEHERQMLPLLIEAAREMNRVYWKQAYGNKDSLLASIADPQLRRFAEINYGPWDRVDGDAPFLPGVGPKPAGANFYPADMTKGEFEAALDARPERVAALKSLYTLVRRDQNGTLTTVPYSEAYAAEHSRAAQNLRAAAELADDPGLKQYLNLRADALLSDDYQPSDLAWMDMKDNGIDIVVGPIETYEDQLYGYKAAHEGVVLVKDKEWSRRLSRYAALLPALQRGLPVPAEYRREKPGTDADLNAYDVVYYAGQANAGSKTIAINLPNDEEVQLAKGTRRLQLKNAMRAKFDRILVPIAGMLIAEDQRQHVTFDAFFGNVMFHEVAHGLGIKNTLDGQGTVRHALQEHASALEEGKADILGLYMVQKLRDNGEISEGELMDDYVTFLAGIFRSVRFGASSAHGRANMIRFNFFEQAGAFSRDEATGAYRVNVAEFEQAVRELSARLLTLQGDGDYAAVDAFVADMGNVGSQLQEDLDRLASASIPVDIVFEQGADVLGL